MTVSVPYLARVSTAFHANILVHGVVEDIQT